MTEKVTITGAPTGGWFTLQLGDYTTRKLAHNATLQEIRAATDEAVAIGKKAGVKAAPKMQVGLNSLTGMSSPGVVITQVPDVDISYQDGYIIDHKNGKRKKP